MKQLSPYEVMQSEVNRIAKTVTDPETADFGHFFIDATAVLSAYGDQNQARNATLCAYALNAMSGEDRASYMESIDLHGRVYQQQVNPDPWPYSDMTVDDQ